MEGFNCLHGLVSGKNKFSKAEQLKICFKLYEIISLIVQAENINSESGNIPFRLKKTVKYINENLKENFTISELAEIAKISEAYFIHSFTKEMGMSPITFINYQKVYEAQKLLSSTDLSVTYIAHELGFSSSQYFARVFSKHIGTTPVQYRSMTRSSSKE